MTAATRTLVRTPASPSSGRRTAAPVVFAWGWIIALLCSSASLAVSQSLTTASSSSGSVKYNEVYFDGSNYIRLGDPMAMWTHSAISFRTCRGGEIMSQSLNQHQFVMIVDVDFVRIVYKVNNTVKFEARIPHRLLDNQWHTIEFQVQLGNLNVIVDKHSTLLANATYNSQLLTDKEIQSNAAILILGKNYAGCLFHGPGFNFASLDENTDKSVLFGPCPMAPGNCSQVQDAPLRKPPVDHCATDPCMQHGRCSTRVDGYACHCTARYNGKNCEVDLGPPCLKKPCQNDGLCEEDVRGNYRCSCGPAYIGQHCETEIALHPQCADQCLNNASCRPGTATAEDPNGADFECVCAPGFVGRHCEIDHNDCVSDPCQNGGQCIDGVDSFRCNCTGTGYVGAVCDVNVDECQSGTMCLHGGTCYDTYGTFTCVCPPGYGGMRCEETISECAMFPCGPGGTCVDRRNGRYECICPNGYADATKMRCDAPVDCGGECQNGGTCEPMPGGSAGATVALGRCSCAPGYDGVHCERTEPCSANCAKPFVCFGGKCVCPEGVDCAGDLRAPCPAAPCENGGTCVTRDNGQLQCQCPTGFNGTLCERNVNECSESPLDANRCHHGVCVNQMGTSRCFCTPGYTGLFCDADVNECLTKPCQNGASCINLENNYQCQCLPGWEGKDCERDIDECLSNPCTHGSTCINGEANYTCKCVPGMAGRNCEIDIDDCLSVPCKHNGQCTDLLNGFLCNCSATGFTGEFCEVNIDECESQPCRNNATCVDEVNDFRCDCVLGYRGKMCEDDIDECESSPCQYNGTCYQHSNRSLYEMEDKSHLPEWFSKPFSYDTANGYECQCIDGIIGPNCETNIDECWSSPCIRGKCVDGIGKFTCNCTHGYEGVLCDVEINECERYEPCQHGHCIDRIGAYHCRCDQEWGGVNCSVQLTGCRDEPCQNGGACSPSLENEITHRFNCSCGDGYQGDRCEKETTMSLTKHSLLTVNTSRSEGYDINFRFRTTLPNGRLVFGSNGGNLVGSYILELVHGRLNLHSSLLNKWEGVFIGAALNDSKWHKVFVSINVTHLLLSANEETTIYPITTYDTNNNNNNSYTTFPVTYLGGTIPHLGSYLSHLRHEPSSFVGCMQDVVINGQWVFPHEANENQSLLNVERGCPRTDQCEPNPCHSNGHCIDEWHEFSCVCERPYLGQRCQFNITAATFAHENASLSTVVVNVTESSRRIVRSVFDISMFIKTRQPTGQVFYMGSNPDRADESSPSFVSAKLQSGELLVRIQLNGTPEEQPVGGNRLDNGFMHLIQVVRNSTLVQVKINGTEYFRKTLSSIGLLDADVLYLGGPPPGAEGSPTDTSAYFKGIIQDVRVSNGSYPMTVELFPLVDLDVPVPPALGEVRFAENSVLPGEVTDDMCRSNPCHHGRCRNTWNDYTCVCPRGYKGKQCQDTQFCEIHHCPGDAVCQNLDDGYECIANTTFHGDEPEPLEYVFYSGESADESASTEAPPVPQQPLRVTLEISYRTKVGGTMFYVKDGEYYFGVAVFENQVTVQWKLNDGLPVTRRFDQDGGASFGWEKIFLRMGNGKLEGGFRDWQNAIDPIPALSQDLDGAKTLQALFSGGQPMYVGGIPHNESKDEASATQVASQGDRFKGCLGEIRVGGLLLPFYNHSEIYPDTFKAHAHYQLDGVAEAEKGCVVCFEKDCLNGGQCSSPSEEYACQCPAGYEGDDCGHNIDECLQAECVNNSTCVDMIAAYECHCQPGFEGRHCEREINECDSAPCQNNGTCIDQLAAFECVCTDKYAGPLCDVLRQVTCDNAPCRNGSTCTDGFNATTGNNFTCTCRPGFVSALCDAPYCDKRQHPCENGGFCLSLEVPEPMCQCSLGYTGRWCEQDVNECESQPCQNGGSCTDMIGSYACDCEKTGFEGKNCETDIDECVVQRIRCGDKGVCVNTRGSFRCNCENGLCGTSCNLTNPCQAYPGICQNSGVCIESCTNVSDYTCNCTEGYAGKNCTELATIKAEGISTTDIAIIVIPIVVSLLIIAGIGLTVFLMMARNKRATRGTYSPSAQEYCNPRLEMDNVLKPPPEERLI